MAHRVVWSRRALQDIEAIAEYIAQDSSAYATAVVKSIVTQAKMLARFPRSGRKVPEFDDETSANCWPTVTESFIAWMKMKC